MKKKKLLGKNEARANSRTNLIDDHLNYFWIWHTVPDWSTELNHFSKYLAWGRKNGSSVMWPVAQIPSLAITRKPKPNVLNACQNSRAMEANVTNGEDEKRSKFSFVSITIDKMINIDTVKISTTNKNEDNHSEQIRNEKRTKSYL